MQGEACALQRDEFLVAVAVGASFSSILGRIIGGVLGNLVDDGLVGEYDDNIIAGLTAFTGLLIIGIVGIGHMGGVLVASGANSSVGIQRGGILNRNDASGLDRGNVLQVGKADLKGAAVGQAFGHNLIVSGNQRSVNIDFHRILIEAQASVFLIVEGQLVAVGVVGVVLRNGGAQLEGHGIADIVVSGILPISGGVRRAVIGVLNLLIGGCGSNLGRDGSGADNLDDIQGVGFTVIDRAVVLDQIVAGEYGQGIAVENGTDSCGVEIDVILNHSQLLSIALAVYSGQSIKNSLVNCFSHGAGAVLAPLDVGQNTLMEVTSEDLVNIIGAGASLGSRNCSVFCRKRGSGQGKDHDQGQQQAGKFLCVFHCVIFFLVFGGG